MKKLTLMFAALMVAAMSFAGTATTVYYTLPSSVVNTQTVKLNVHYGCNSDDGWGTFDMTLYSDTTYNGDPIYSVSFEDYWDGLCAMQFQLYEGTTWKSQQEVFNGSWQNPVAYNNLMYVYATQTWVSLPGAASQEVKYYIAGTMNNWTTDNENYMLVDGKIVLNLDKGEHQFKITNGAWASQGGVEYTYSDVDTECSTATLTESGGNIVFTLAEKQDVTISLSEDKKICVKATTGEIENVYVIAGDEALTGYYWEGSATEAPENVMTLEDGVATLVKENLALKADTYKYKVVKNGATWIPAGDDLEVAIADSGVYKITYTYKEGEKTATAVAERTDTPVVPDVFTVAGSSTAVFGTAWDATNTDNDMTEMTVEGVTGYVLIKQNVELKADDTIQWKVVKNHSWDVNYGDSENNNDNYQYIITKDGKYNAAFVFVEIAGYGHMAEATFEPVDSAATVYYLAGNKELTGYNWAPDSLAMIDGVIILKDVPAGTHAFKITDGQWNTAEDNTHEFTELDSDCVSANVTHDAGGNITFTTEKVQNIIITIQENGKICVSVEAIVPQVIYTVAGNAVNGDNWDITNTDNEMQLVDGIYTLVVTGVTLEQGHKIEYKIIKGHSWSDEEVFPKTGSNAVYEITEETAVYTITYTYNPTNGAVNIKLEKTGEAQPITHVYSLVGDFFSWNWDPANAPEMTKVNDSIYTYQIDTFAITTAPDTLYFKLTADHEWGVYELPSEGDYYYIFNQIGAYQLNFTANIASHYMVLDAILLKTDTTVVETKYYLAGSMNSWNAKGDELVNGQIVLTLAAGKHQFKVTDGTWNNTWGYDQVDQECSTATVTRGTGNDDNNIIIELAKEQEVTISFDAATGKVCVKAETGEAPKVYYIAGDEGLMGEGHGWWKDYADRALVNGTITIKDVPAGAHAFKITDGNWNSSTETGHEFTALDTECSSNGVTGGNGNNIEFTTYKVQDVTITMDLTTFAICVTADCEKPAEFEDTYVIAGDSALLGVNWSGTAEQNKMTVTDSVASLVLDSIHLAAGNYEFKVVKNGGEWIPDGPNNNSSLSVNADGYYRVTFTYIIGSTAATAEAELLSEPVVVDVDYYLFGYINGANYGCEDDYQNMGDYKFVDGKLTATFTEKSYVAVKTTDNATWYMTNGYPGDDATTAVLYNTQNLGENADKLPVPANVTVNFTLVVNADATLTLSYIADGTDGLENVEALLDVNAPMYNVLGQKVNHFYKGIVIQNGKKFLLR